MLLILFQRRNQSLFSFFKKTSVSSEDSGSYNLKLPFSMYMQSTYCILDTGHVFAKQTREQQKLVASPHPPTPTGETSLHPTQTSLGSTLLYCRQGVRSSSEYAAGIHVMSQPTLYLVLTFGYSFQNTVGNLELRSKDLTWVFMSKNSSINLAPGRRVSLFASAGDSSVWLVVILHQ